MSQSLLNATPVEMPQVNGKHFPRPQSLHLFDILMKDESVSEIMINRYDRIYVEKAGQIYDAGFSFESPETIDQLADNLVRRCGKEFLTRATCIVDGVLPDGTRINVVTPPIAVDGTSISIRKFPRKAITMPFLVENAFMNSEIARFLQCAVEARVNIMVSGNTSSGKTTLVGALSSFIGSAERIITIEDTPELQLQHRNVVRLSTRSAAHGHDISDITIRDLVRNSLRMRPDRLIIGEVRGGEALDLMHALNTGHTGSLSTVHANSPRDTLTRLEHMVHLAGSNIPSHYIRAQLPLSIELIVQTHRDENGFRHVTHVTEVVGMEKETLILQNLFVHRAEGGYTMEKPVMRSPRIRATVQRMASPVV